MALQVIVTTSFDRVMDWMRGRETTLTLNDVLSPNGGTPLSVTWTVIGLTVLAKVSAGVQVSTPLTGPMLAPEGAPVPRLKVKVFVGRSVSLAELVMTNAEPAWMVRSAT